MKKVKFDDVIKDITGGNKKIKTTEYLDDGILPIIDQSSKFISGFTNEVNKVKTNRKDVIIFGDHTKEFKYINFDFCIGADGVKILEPINELNTKYLYYFFQTVYLPNVGYSRHFKFLKETEIPLPPLSQQKAIAAQLDKAQELVQYNEQLIEKYDELQQSLFLDMFGDPVINEKGWEMVEFEDILSLKRGYDLSMSNRNLDGNIDVYGSNGILSKHDSYKVDSPIIITGRSGTIGKVFISNDKCWPLNTTLYSYKTNENNIIYLSFLMRFFRLERFSHGVGVPTLDRNIVHKEKLPKIPLALQNDFAQKIDSIEIQKEQAKEALAKSKDIFQGLLQEHFM